LPRWRPFGIRAWKDSTFRLPVSVLFQIAGETESVFPQIALELIAFCTQDAPGNTTIPLRSDFICYLHGQRGGKAMRYLITSPVGAVLIAGCSTFVPVTDVSQVPKAQLREAAHVRVFVLGGNQACPEVAEYLGDVTAYSCKHLLTDPPASKGDALTQLRLKVLDLGADGVIDVSFDRRGTGAWGTNCWESVQASGTAVKFKQ
jgi:uncharacterized protein YbjQ (UPF0145 family)